MVCALAPSSALAHPGRALAPHDLWSAWTLEPVVVFGLLLSAALYLRGVGALWRRAGVGAGVAKWAATSFAAGWLMLVVALVSPLDAMGGVLFSAHMAQHEVLMVVAAPLLVLGRPLVPMLWAVPPAWRRAAGRVTRHAAVQRPWATLTRPAPATAIHAVVLWAWHAPALFVATLQSELAHALQHVSFLGTALLFWWALLSPRARRVHSGPAVFYLFLTMMHTGVLGALATFAPTPWYAPYLVTTRPWGLTALEDQQLAGLVMWVPASAAYVVAALWLSARWLREAEHRSPVHGGIAPLQ